MWPFASTFFKLSKRLLPLRSGITSRESSSTRTKPGASPLGETSQVPSAPDVAISRNGDIEMNFRDCSYNALRSLITARSLGAPSTIVRSSASVVTSDWKGVMSVVNHTTSQRHEGRVGEGGQGGQVGQVGQVGRWAGGKS